MRSPWGAWACLWVLVLSCTSTPTGPGPDSGVPGPPSAEPEPRALVRPGPLPGAAAPQNLSQAPLAPNPLDLARWPQGWVDDPQGPRLGLPERFWSDRRLLWTEALADQTPASRRVRNLTLVHDQAGDRAEALRAAWHLWLVCSGAGLGDRGRQWLDRCAELSPGHPAVALHQIWDQRFRLGDPWGARALWPAGGFALDHEDDARKERLLRQRLFLATQSLASAGADDYVATLALDQDDVWVGTWNGAVLRWSLTTGTLDRLLAPAAVAPITRLVATAWFVYAFQDQSLLRYSKVTGTWRTFAYPGQWSGLRVGGALAEGEETLWVAHLGQGLWRWERGQWTQVDAEGGGPFLTALAGDGRDGFWVGTKDRGLWHWSAGQWTPVKAPPGGGPTNVSALSPGPPGLWAVGTWGEGTWILQDGSLVPVSGGREFVTATGWSGDRPLWGTLDEGILAGQGGDLERLGPLDGLPPGGVSALVVWEGRWIWGTTGQGLGWWSQHENPALHR